MKFEQIAGIILGCIVLGILGGFAARSWWIGIALPIVLVVMFFMWLAISQAKPETPSNVEKKEENTTQPKQE